MEFKCTGKYDGLVRNGVGGDLNKPCAGDLLGVQLYCNQADVDGWEITAWDLFRRVRAEWNATVQTHEIPDEVRRYITQMEDAYCLRADDGTCSSFLLPKSSWYDIGANAAAAVEYAKWCARAACALELLDQVRSVTGPVESTQKNDDVAAKAGEAAKKVVEGAGGLLEGAGKALAWLPFAVVGTAAIGVIGLVLYRKTSPTGRPDAR